MHKTVVVHEYTRLHGKVAKLCGLNAIGKDADDTSQRDSATKENLDSLPIESLELNL